MPAPRRPSILSRLAPDELTDLVRYAAANGRSWKSKLLDAWMSGRDQREPDASALRRVRNTVGPSGLLTLTLCGLEIEIAAREGAR